VEHVFCSLLEVFFASESRKRDFLRKEIYLEDIPFCHGVFEVAFPASIMLKGRANVPPDLAVFSVGRSCLGGGMSDDSCSLGCQWRSVEVEVPKE